MTVEKLDGTSPRLYALVAPLVMRRSVLRQNNNYPFWTSRSHTWFVAWEGEIVFGFVPVEITDGGITKINNYYVSGDDPRHADAAFQPIPPDVVDAEIEQHAAVLASGEGDVDVVEGLENGFQPPLCPLVDVHGRRFFPYSMATYSFHSRTGTNPSARNTSAWRVSVTERIV